MDWRLLAGVICLIGIVLAGSSAYVTLVNSQRAIHYNELGLKAMEDGDYYAAIEYFSMAIAADPNFAIAYYNRGNAYGNEEQFHRYYKLPGQTFTEAGYPEMQEKYEKALEDFKWIIEHPEITKREVAQENYYLEAHIALACTYAKLDRMDEAKGVLEKILSELDSDVTFTGLEKIH